MTAFKIEINDEPVIDALNKLAAQANDLTPAMRAIAAALESQTEDNFATESGPLGKWPALAGSTRSARAKKGKWPGMMLQMSAAGLASSVHSYATSNEAGIGANAVYAAIHQLGGQTKPHTILPRDKKALAFGGRVVKKVNHPGSLIPPRPFLPWAEGGLQAGIEERVLEIIQDYLLRR